MNFLWNNLNIAIISARQPPEVTTFGNCMVQFHALLVNFVQNLAYF